MFKTKLVIVPVVIVVAAIAYVFMDSTVAVEAANEVEVPITCSEEAQECTDGIFRKDMLNLPASSSSLGCFKNNEAIELCFS